MSADIGRKDRWTLAELAQHLGGRPKGSSLKSVTHVADLESALDDSVSYCVGQIHQARLNRTEAGIVILPELSTPKYSGNCILVQNPRAAFAKAVKLLHRLPKLQPGIDRTAVLAPSCRLATSVQIQANVVVGRRAKIGERVFLGHGSVIGDGVEIGPETRIAPNVTIYRNCKIGHSCRISAGAVIGASGHSYEWEDGQWTLIPNIGSVIIGDNVDIGAATTIDRGSIQATVIANGVKIDNNVQIGHNTQIDEHTMIAGNAGIAGSVRMGKRCIMGGQAGIVDHVKITDDVTIQVNSLVTKSILKSGIYSSVLPAKEANVWKRTLAKLNKLGRE